MEGFVPERYDEILGLTKRGLTAVVICAAGYRSPGDATQHYAKVRLPVEEMFTVVQDKQKAPNYLIVKGLSIKIEVGSGFEPLYKLLQSFA